MYIGINCSLCVHTTESKIVSALWKVFALWLIFFIQTWSSQAPMFATIGKALEGKSEKVKMGELKNTYSNSNQSKRKQRVLVSVCEYYVNLLKFRV